MLEKVDNLKNTVKQILTENPDTRDNDFLLMLKVWANQEPKLRMKGYFWLDWAIPFRDGHYTDPESIRRTRQKLQEEFEYLRGINYRVRQIHAKKVRKYFSKYY